MHIRTAGAFTELFLMFTGKAGGQILSSVHRLYPAILTSLVVLAPTLGAHPLSFTQTTITLKPDNTFQVDIVCDLDALALGVPQDSDDSALVSALQNLSSAEFTEHSARLRQLFIRRVRVRFDNNPQPFEVSFPDHGRPQATESEIPTVFGLTARLVGTIPSDATQVDFFASRSFSQVHLEVIDMNGGTTGQSVLERGGRSEPFQLITPVNQPTQLRVISQYFRLGFSHILPGGYDHLLFILGLFLLSLRLKTLFWQITAFTIAHAMTLALSALQIGALSASLVEPLIALSIVWVGLENTITNNLKPWRPFLVFFFGLLHGSGFAGALIELGLPTSDRLFALLAFNLGIEIAQLTMIVLAFGTLGWFQHRPWYRKYIAVPLSIIIAVFGFMWTLERVFS